MDRASAGPVYPCVRARWSLPVSVLCDIPRGFRPDYPVLLGHSLSPQATWPAPDYPSALVVCPLPLPWHHTWPLRCPGGSPLAHAHPASPQGPAVQGAPPRHGHSGGGPGWTTPQVLPPPGPPWLPSQSCCTPRRPPPPWPLSPPGTEGARPAPTWPAPPRSRVCGLSGLGPCPRQQALFASCFLTLGLGSLGPGCWSAPSLPSPPCPHAFLSPSPTAPMSRARATGPQPLWPSLGEGWRASLGPGSQAAEGTRWGQAVTGPTPNQGDGLEGAGEEEGGAKPSRGGGQLSVTPAHSHPLRGLLPVRV